MFKAWDVLTTEPYLKSTNQHLKDLLPTLLRNLEGKTSLRPDLVVQAWGEVAGERISSMTRAVSFENGALHVLVKNSTLMSLLALHEKGRLLKGLQKQFPKVKIRNIHFKIGHFAPKANCT